MEIQKRDIAVHFFCFDLLPNTILELLEKLSNGIQGNVFWFYPTSHYLGEMQNKRDATHSSLFFDQNDLFSLPDKFSR